MTHAAPEPDRTGATASVDAVGAAGATDRADATEHGLTRADVAHLAHLARLDLTDAELDLYRDQLSVILDAVAAVTAVATPDVEPTSHAVPLTNVFREDEPRPGLTREQALDQAPAAEDGRFRVPQILGEE